MEFVSKRKRACERKGWGGGGGWGREGLAEKLRMRWREGSDWLGKITDRLMEINGKRGWKLMARAAGESRES